MIWTTTPWTLPANLAIAYNSTFSYSLVRVGGEAYIVSTMLLSTVAEKCRWENFEIVRSIDGDQLSRVEFQHPFCNRTGRLFAGDSFVENSTGTGFVHRSRSRPRRLQPWPAERIADYSPVDDNGAFTHTNDLPIEQQMPAHMIGKSILGKHGKSEANEVVLEELRARNALLHREDYSHSYPFCWRSKTPGDLSRDGPMVHQHRPPEFSREALAAIDSVNWIPDWGKNRIESAVKTRPDWCISRQRTWGGPSRRSTTPKARRFSTRDCSQRRQPGRAARIERLVRKAGC